MCVCVCVYMCSCVCVCEREVCVCVWGGGGGGGRERGGSLYIGNSMINDCIYIVCILVVGFGCSRKLFI